ncbi:MAG TPA: hypothetical protein VGB98_02440 [Pyrinomonadaceae bacterium]|jgi:hypothetical protein
MNSKQTLKTAPLALLLLLLCAPVASAQSARRLRLVRGAGEAAGVLRPGTREARHEYLFTAKAGQRLSVRVTSGRVRMGEAGKVGAVFHVTDAERNTPAEFGDYPYGGPKEWAGVLRAGVYKIIVFIEDTPDDPDEATQRRMNLSLRYRLRVTLR